jgi:hypothetical protein
MVGDNIKRVSNNAVAMHRMGTPIAVMLSALSALVAESRTPALAIEWISSSAFAPEPSKLAVSERTLPHLGFDEGRESNIGKIVLARDPRDKGCEMSPEEFAKFYPPLLDWIRGTLASSANAGQTVASRGLPRLPLYFTENTLVSTKVVLVDRLPVPPLRSMGLAQFADFERGEFDGITYMDTVFLKPTQSTNENLHFHELVHVIQWRLLGPERFLFSYANGLQCFGYRDSPLEAMAYDAEEAFASSTAIFNVEKVVAEKLGFVNQ